MIIKDGDYFSYSWKSGLGPSSDPYWCCDRRCVARTDNHGDIVLIDTYNYWPFKDGKEDTNIFTHEGLAREYAKDDYEGVVFVGYQCTKKWAKPKGSDVSKNMVLKKMITERDNLLDEIQYKQSRVEQLNGQIGGMK